MSKNIKIKKLLKGYKGNATRAHICETFNTITLAEMIKFFGDYRVEDWEIMEDFESGSDIVLITVEKDYLKKKNFTWQGV
jgi:hypothetical protein